jgi:hypothetical protein
VLFFDFCLVSQVPSNEPIKILCLLDRVELLIIVTEFLIQLEQQLQSQK